MSERETANFVAKVSTVKTRKDRDYFVYRMNVPKEVGEKLDLANGDYLVLNGRKAKWYDLLDWREMPKTMEMMPASLREEISKNCMVVPSSATSQMKINIVLSALVSVQSQLGGGMPLPTAPTIMGESPEPGQTLSPSITVPIQVVR